MSKIKVANPNLSTGNVLQKQATTYPAVPHPTPLQTAINSAGNWAEVIGKPSAEEPGTPHNVHEAKVAEKLPKLYTGQANEHPTHDAAVGNNEKIGPVPEREGCDPAVSALTSPGVSKL